MYALFAVQDTLCKGSVLPFLQNGQSTSKYSSQFVNKVNHACMIMSFNSMKKVTVKFSKEPYQVADIAELRYEAFKFIPYEVIKSLREKIPSFDK